MYVSHTQIVTGFQREFYGTVSMLEIRIRNWLAVLENRIFYRLLITVLLKMYRKYGQPKWILVGQMLKLVGKWPMAYFFKMPTGYHVAY